MLRITPSRWTLRKLHLTNGVSVQDSGILVVVEPSRLAAVLVCIATFLLGAGGMLAAQGQPLSGRPASKALAEFSSAVQDLAQSLSPAVVQIEVRARVVVEESEGRRSGFVKNESATGSGVILDAEGYIVTNAHVVLGARKVDVSVLRSSGAGAMPRAHTHYSAKIVGVDKESDLAVIKIDAHGLPTLSFLDSDTLRQGQVVLALGSPLGLENSLSVGYISAPIRHLEEDSPMSYVQTDAPINPGNSGGPLLDIQGRIAGINTLILTQSGGSEGIGFAIPANIVKRVYQELRAEGHVHRGAIGVIAQEITPTLTAALHLKQSSGLILADVLPHSAAESAGLKPGDVLLSVDGHDVTEPQHLSGEVFQHAVGETITLQIVRDGTPMEKTVPVLERKKSPGGLADLASEDANLVRQLGILACTLDVKALAILGELRAFAGVVVAAIPAEYSFRNPGLVSGDIIVSVNGTNVDSLQALQTALRASKAGDPMALRVERNGQMIYVVFELE
jgi:serine protease Do